MSLKELRENGLNFAVKVFLLYAFLIFSAIVVTKNMKGR